MKFFRFIFVIFLVGAVIFGVGYFYNNLQSASHQAEVREEPKSFLKLLDLPQNSASGGSVVTSGAVGAPEALLQAVKIFEATADSDENLRAKLRSAIFSYSRKDNNKNTKIVLQQALAKELISEKEYFGELAHMLSVDVNNPVEIIHEIFKSGNRYGAEVAYMTMQNAPWIDGLPVVQKDEVFNQLLISRPDFPYEISMLGSSDVYRYENWLKSLEQFYGKDDFLSYLDKFVLSEAKEPREFFALIDGGYYQELISAGKNNSVNFIDRATREYVNSYPKNGVALRIYQKKNNIASVVE